MNDDELSALIRNRATRYKAGDRLRAGVRTQIALQSAARADDEGDEVIVAHAALGRRPGFAGFAGFNRRSAMAGFAGGVALTLALGWALPRFVLPDSLPDQLVASHVRALKVGPLIEVASSDRHTVKPWFQGKLDYAPQVIDLDAAGFTLLGGRVDHVAGAPTAALAYKHHQHLMNVFVWTSHTEQAPQHLQRNGFNVLHWSDGAMQVWVVSDVEAADLDQFGAAWRARVAAR